ncbi:MAG: thiamine diphosphokinase [Actinomycetota bacterium]
MADAVACAIVLAGGELPPVGALARVLAGGTPLVVAADSGLDHAHALGLRVDVVVGDLDSVSDAAVARARAAGTEFETHPVDKDATDLELALATARARGARRITVVGGGGGRHDHLLANALVLAIEDFADLELDALVGTARITVVRSRTELHGRPGALCSLLPVGGVARAVHTDGLRFPLHGEDLLPGSTRGISNELLGTTAVVTVGEGVVLAVQPHALEEA